MQDNFYGSLTLVTNDQQKMECNLSHLSLLLSGVCHGCLVHFVNIPITLTYALWNLTLTKNLLVNDKITASCSTNMLPIPSIISNQERTILSLDQTLRTTKMNFEKLLSKFSKTHNFNPF